MIIDDEPRAVQSLRLLIEKHCPEVAIVGTTNKLAEAYQLIVELNPDVLFLDVNMPKGSGIDFIERSNLPIKVVFTTAHQEYAIKAIRLSAIDYLLKPIVPKELVNAVLRLSTIEFESNSLGIAKTILKGNKPDKIGINTIEGTQIISLAGIKYLQSDKNYTTFFTNTEKIIASKPIGEYEKLLSDFDFIRIHRSFIVNLSRVKEYKKGKEPVLVVDDGAELPISRGNLDQFKLDMQQYLKGG